MKCPSARKLAADIDAFLRFKRSLGYRYERPEFWLKAFAQFVERRPGNTPFENLARAWLARNESRKARTVAHELDVLRQFFAFLRRHDSTVIVPARDWAPRSSVSNFLPHVLETKDVKTLLRLAEKLGAPPFCGTMYRVFLLVLYCTGVRFGEAVRLKFCDLDVRRQAFWITESKGRARWVPFHASLGRELARYLVARRAFAAARPGDTLFVGIKGGPLRCKTASHTVRVLLRRAGLKPPRGRSGPRPYDLRHTFAVHRLASWYRAGVDVRARLPWLSAYMGHDNLLGTETYLTATPDLLHLAARRLHARLSQRRRWK